MAMQRLHVYKLAFLNGNNTVTLVTFMCIQILFHLLHGELYTLVRYSDLSYPNYWTCDANCYISHMGLLVRKVTEY